jgi:hypothetical protein
LSQVPYAELRRRLLAGRQVLDILPESAPRAAPASNLKIED